MSLSCGSKRLNQCISDGVWEKSRDLNKLLECYDSAYCRNMDPNKLSRDFCYVGLYLISCFESLCDIYSGVKAHINS
jgi:hypothetical protein